MLSRRYLRIKVMQAIYAYIQSGNTQVENGVDALVKSIDKIYELFIWQLSFLVETGRCAERRLEELKNKQLPTYDDLNPNKRYVNNRVLAQINNNIEFRKWEEQLKIDWSQSPEMFRKFYLTLNDQPEFKKYMADEKNSYRQDQNILLKIVSEFLPDFELLHDFFEDQSIHYADDYDLSLCLVYKYLNDLHEADEANQPLPSLYKTQHDEVNEDLNFVKKLYRLTINNNDNYAALIAENTSNWEKERIAIMDMIIVKMGMTEFEYFPSIPVKVTINEYIELSKSFSTPKSKLFVNGILDRILKIMSAAGRVEKSGRGLLDD